MAILFIQTGGTIDKDYPRTVKGYAFEIGKPAVEKILVHIQPGFSYKIITVLKKDSQNITAKDRKKIFDVCNRSKYNKIIITHGTDTIIQTAKFLLPIQGKTIILTGSFKPETFKNSDAGFNLGFALGALENTSAGIYIALNGRLFSAQNVQRKKNGQFTEKET